MEKQNLKSKVNKKVLICELCGKNNNLEKTDCCGNLICNDENNYVLFSYARNSCARNHRRFTLCGYHNSEEHKGDWKDCKKCLDSFSHKLEMYVWYGTNEYNFENLPNPLKFKPTLCSGCKVIIPLPEGGFTSFKDKYACEKCMNSGFDLRK